MSLFSGNVAIVERILLTIKSGHRSTTFHGDFRLSQLDLDYEDHLQKFTFQEPYCG